MSEKKDAAAEGGVIDAADYMDELTAALGRHGLGPDNLELVEDVHDPMSPFRKAACYKIEKRIVLKRLITAEERAGVMEALRGFDPRAEQLSDPLLFLKHAVLHEACHILWRYKNCNECDAWAFYEMRL